MVVNDVVAGDLGEEDGGVPTDMTRSVLTDLHVLQLLLIDRNLLTHHLLGLVTDLGVPGRYRRPLVIMTTVTVTENLPPVTFLLHYLPTVSPPVATHVLHCLLACPAAPVVLHLALDALHGHHLGLTALTGGGLRLQAV